MYRVTSSRVLCLTIVPTTIAYLLQEPPWVTPSTVVSDADRDHWMHHRLKSEPVHCTRTECSLSWPTQPQPITTLLSPMEDNVHVCSSPCTQVIPSCNCDRILPRLGGGPHLGQSMTTHLWQRIEVGLTISFKSLPQPLLAEKHITLSAWLALSYQNTLNVPCRGRTTVVVSDN